MNKFITKSDRPLTIPQKKLIIGVLIGLTYSFVFYSFLYLIRESFRFISFSESYDLWLLNEAEVNFYNLFFAFIAVINSLSYCFIYWFDKPKKIFEIGNLRQKSIINDQRNLNWFFLSWFSKIAIIFGMLFSSQSLYYTLSLYPNYNYIFILIIIVLFFQIWNTLRLTYRKKSLKWILVSIVSVSIVSFFLSKINLIDYNKLNNIVLSKNEYHKYNIDLPIIKQSETHKTKYNTPNIFVVESQNQSYNIIMDKKRIDYDNLSENLIELKLQSYLPKFKLQLHIDKDIRMSFINKLKYELSRIDVNYIAYTVLPENALYDDNYYKNNVFPIRINDFQILEYGTPFNSIKKDANLISIKKTSSRNYIINDSIIKPESYSNLIKTYLHIDQVNIFKLYINDNDSFSSYINSIAEFKEMILELRNDYSKTKYSIEYLKLDYYQKREVQDKIPFVILEMTQEVVNKYEKKKLVLTKPINNTGLGV